MAGSRDDDLFEGVVSRARGRGRETSPARFPKAAGAGDSRRARAAWFTRQTGAGSVKLAPERPAGSQRVIIKARVVVHAKAAGGAGAMMRHTLYVERDGAGRDGDAVQVFDREADKADGAGFVERCEGDRHHFRVIVAPEFGGQIESLRDYTRELMRRVEADLSTRIDWIAAEHHDTGRPHVHLLMRGVREDGRDLVIPRAYVSHGFRGRAEGLATELIGPRLEQGLSHQLEQRAERAADLVRSTDLDRVLRECARDGEVAVRDLPDGPARDPLVRRLNRLEDWGLAQRAEPGLWRLDDELEAKLIRLGDKRERERATARLLAREQRRLEPERTRELEQAHSSQPVQGRLLGFEQMGSDARGPYLIGVDGIDGKLWTARVARVEDLRALNGVERGAIVSLERAQPDLKPSDRTIWEIAADNGLHYSRAIHQAERPSDRPAFIQAHERRLEALRMEGIVERASDGSFRIPRDYRARVLARESMGARESARVTLLDPHPLEKQTGYCGPTWLDRVAGGSAGKVELQMEGFGRQAAEAWKQRETTLASMRLGEIRADGFHSVEGWKDLLANRESHDLLLRIERDTGLVAHVAGDGARVQGLFTGRIHMAEQSFAVVVQDRTIALAPWRPEMDRALNQYVSGRVDGGRFDFNYGKEAEKALRRGLGIDR